MRLRLLAGCTLLSLLFTPPPAQAQEPSIEVMVLGVFHFHNPNADYAQFEGIDVLTPERQREIEAVTAQLAAFRPTRIAVEHPPHEADSINARYARYQQGTFALTRNETHQLGFRLAAHLGHEALYPVDYRIGLRIDSVMAYASEHDPAFAARIGAMIGEVQTEMDRRQREESIGANLRYMNTPEHLDFAHSPYADMATVGVADDHLGARVVTRWYERNLRIFANLARIAEPGDRVLLIIGQGHAPILRELVRTHPSMTLVEALDHLH